MRQTSVLQGTSYGYRIGLDAVLRMLDFEGFLFDFFTYRYCG